jgi:O-antigen/teichoic acid export membrane protein
LVAFTPLAGVWFETVSGLTPDLTSYALIPARILAPLPALSVVLSLQRAILVQGRRTRPITGATLTEVTGIVLIFAVFGWGFDLVGVTAAIVAFVGGRLGGNLFLVPSCRRVLARP